MFPKSFQDLKRHKTVEQVVHLQGKSRGPRRENNIELNDKTANLNGFLYFSWNGYVVDCSALLHYRRQAARHIRSKPNKPCVTGQFSIPPILSKWIKIGNRLPNVDSSALKWQSRQELRSKIHICTFQAARQQSQSISIGCRIRLDCYWVVSFFIELPLHNNTFFSDLLVLLHLS